MTYLLGIDASKFKHDCIIADEYGSALTKPFTIENNRNGFNVLLETLKDLKSQGEIKIGFEATGHYTMNLKLFLEASGFSYMELNPLLVKDFIRSKSLRKTKTDKKDSKWIALYLAQVDYKPYQGKFYHLYSLKSLTRLRHSLIENKSLYLVKITNILDHIFPEIKPYFNNKFTSSLFYILDNYLTPSHIKNMTIESYNNMVSKLKKPISYQRFMVVKELAKNTVGISNSILEFELKSLLKLYHNLEDEISKIELEIESHMNIINPKTSTIPGIGIQSASVIVSEIGDFNRFSSPEKLLAFIGLDPAKYQSGTECFNGHMVKHGSPNLRYIIMNCSETFYVHNPVISDYYWKKRNEGKPHGVALSHVARKLVSVIYYLETNNLDFDSSKLR